MTKFDACLRFNQMLLYVVTLASGLVTCLGSGWVSQILAGKCVLYSDMNLVDGPNRTVSLATVKSAWGPKWTCEYCTFTTATAAINAVIWFWFYVLLSEHKYSEREDRFKLTGLLNIRQANDKAPSDVKLFLPSLVLNIALFVCVCVSVAFFNGGIDSWCLNYFTSTRGSHKCEYLGQVVWTNVTGGNYVYIYTKVALVGNWTLLAALGLKIVLLSCRIHNYFHHVKRPRRNDEDGGRNEIREELIADDVVSNTSLEECVDGAFLIAV